MDGSQFVGPIGPGEEVSTAKRRGRNWSLRWLLMALTIPLLLVGSILYGHYTQLTREPENLRDR